MKKYNVTYYYLATGMEGVPDTEDYGIIEAEDAEAAKDKIALHEYSDDIMYGPDNKYSTREFFRGCLRAVEIL